MMATRHYRKTVRRRGQTGAGVYDVTISEPFGGVEDARRRWERHRRETERRKRAFERRQREKEARRRRGDNPTLVQALTPLIKLMTKPPTLAAPSFDLQLWLSRSGETWVTLMQRVRDGSPVAYDLYVYTPGDFVWNFVGTWPEYRPALAAKDWWVEYAEQGGTYQTWLASEVLNAN